LWTAKSPRRWAGGFGTYAFMTYIAAEKTTAMVSSGKIHIAFHLLVVGYLPILRAISNV
jgi:hypothetical protein